MYRGGLCLSVLGILTRLGVFFGLSGVSATLALCVGLPVLFNNKSPGLLCQDFCEEAPSFLARTVTRSIFILDCCAKRSLRSGLRSLPSSGLGGFLAYVVAFSGGPGTRFMALVESPRTLKSRERTGIADRVGELTIARMLDGTPGGVFTGDTRRCAAARISLGSMVRGVRPACPRKLEIICRDLPFCGTRGVIGLVSNAGSVAGVLRGASTVSCASVRETVGVVEGGVALLVEVLPLSCGGTGLKLLDLGGLDVASVDGCMERES